MRCWCWFLVILGAALAERLQYDSETGLEIGLETNSSSENWPWSSCPRQQTVTYVAMAPPVHLIPIMPGQPAPYYVPPVIRPSSRGLPASKAEDVHNKFQHSAANSWIQNFASSFQGVWQGCVAQMKESLNGEFTYTIGQQIEVPKGGSCSEVYLARIENIWQDPDGSYKYVAHYLDTSLNPIRDSKCFGDINDICDGQLSDRINHMISLPCVGQIRDHIVSDGWRAFQEFKNTVANRVASSEITLSVGFSAEMSLLINLNSAINPLPWVGAVAGAVVVYPPAVAGTILYQGCTGGDTSQNLLQLAAGFSLDIGFDSKCFEGTTANVEFTVQNIAGYNNINAGVSLALNTKGELDGLSIGIEYNWQSSQMTNWLTFFDTNKFSFKTTMCMSKEYYRSGSSVKTC